MAPAGRLAAILVVLCLLASPAGCGGADAPVPADHEREVAVAEGSPEDAGPLTAAAVEDFDYEEYESELADGAALIDEFWESTFQDIFGESYGPPSDVYGYYPDDDYQDVECGGEPAATPENAFYCGETDEIAWDEPGLFIPYYRENGDLAVGIVLAHEWGHLIQNRLELDFPITYEQELNADCLAGAWLGGMEDEGLLDGRAPGERGDIDEAIESIFSLGDSPDTPFEDPEAHGQPEERVDALGTGYEGGVEACDEEYAPGWAEDQDVDLPAGAAAATGDSYGDG